MLDDNLLVAQVFVGDESAFLCHGYVHRKVCFGRSLHAYDEGQVRSFDGGARAGDRDHRLVVGQRDCDAAWRSNGVAVAVRQGEDDRLVALGYGVVRDGDGN